MAKVVKSLMMITLDWRGWHNRSALSRVRTLLGIPWKSLNFNALKGVENCSRCRKVLEFQCLLYPTRFSSAEKEQTQKGLQDKELKLQSCCGRTKKGRLKTLFCTEWSPWKMGNVSLKVREKSLNFLFKNGYASWPSSICDNRAKFMQHYRGFTIKL